MVSQEERKATELKELNDGPNHSSMPLLGIPVSGWQPVAISTHVKYIEQYSTWTKIAFWCKSMRQQFRDSTSNVSKTLQTEVERLLEAYIRNLSFNKQEEYLKEFARSYRFKRLSAEDDRTHSVTAFENSKLHLLPRTGQAKVGKRDGEAEPHFRAAGRQLKPQERSQVVLNKFGASSIGGSI